MTDLIDRVWEYSKNNPDGFTLNLDTMKPVKYGIVAAYLETQNSFGKVGLKKAIEHALKNDRIVGGWLDDKSGFFYFDSCKVFKNSEIHEAILFAEQNEQIALFDLTNLKEIRIGG